MKKLLLSLLCFSFFCTSQLYAQGVSYGFKLGFSYSQIGGYEFDVENRGIDGDTAISAFDTVENGRYGFSAAFLAEIPITNLISFQPEFAFSSQGNKFEGVRFDYLQIPLGLRFNFNKLFVIAGPQAGIKVSFYEQSDNYKSVDFSAFGSIGYHFTDSVFIEARFTKGFLEIFEDDAAIRLPFIEEPEDIEVNGEIVPSNNGNRANGDNFLVNNSGTNQYFTFSIGYKL